jgi:hypothetical protein
VDLEIFLKTVFYKVLVLLSTTKRGKDLFFWILKAKIWIYDQPLYLRHLGFFVKTSTESVSGAKNVQMYLYWITLPKNHFIENFWPKHHLTERRLTECHLTESSFHRKVICFFRKWSFDRIYFRQKISKMRKVFPILMMNQGCFIFCQKLFRPNDYFSKKSIRSNDLSVKWPFFGKSFRSYEQSVKWPIGQMTIFR